MMNDQDDQSHADKDADLSDLVDRAKEIAEKERLKQGNMPKGWVGSGPLKREKTKSGGGCLLLVSAVMLLLGVILVLVALLSDTTVQSDVGRVHNIGLQQSQMVTLIIGALTILIGVIFMVAGIIKRK